MIFYRKTYHNATRAAFARQAVRLEFRPRDARAIDHDGFVDRKPHERPHRPPENFKSCELEGFASELNDLIGREAA